MNTIHAYADDSITSGGGGRLFVAAYLQSAETWAKFSEQWDACLREQPAIRYLKMTEATRRQGEFRDWSERKRDQKIEALATIIQRNNLSGFFTSVSVKDFNELVKPYAPYPLARPYSLAYAAMILGISHLFDEGSNFKVKLIFDQQDGMADRINPVFDSLFSRAPSHWRNHFVGPPEFKDDKVALPLQAADMLVWLIRRESEYGSEDAFTLLRSKAIPEGRVLFTRIEREQMQVFSDGFRDLRYAKHIDKKEWDAISETYEKYWHLFS